VTVGIAGAGVGGAVGRGLTLYYIRHAEVVANTIPADQITYENSETITDLGQRQIDALTSYLRSLDVTPDAVLVSPAKRTQKTIEPFLVASNLTGEIWTDLYECCQQTPTGAVLPSTPQYQTYLKAKIEAENLDFRDANQTQFWLTDTYEQGLFMVMTAKDEILSRFGQSGKTIFVIGHASAGQVMIGLLRGNDMTLGTSSTDPNAVYVLNTGVMRLIQDPATGIFKLDGRNINKPQTQ
jgi:broad specificity phosphatase PhoE